MRRVRLGRAPCVGYALEARTGSFGLSDKQTKPRQHNNLTTVFLISTIEETWARCPNLSRRVFPSAASPPPLPAPARRGFISVGIGCVFFGRRKKKSGDHDVVLIYFSFGGGTRGSMCGEREGFHLTGTLGFVPRHPNAASPDRSLDQNPCLHVGHQAGGGELALFPEELRAHLTVKRLL